MSVEVLVATMHQKNTDLYQQMNLQSPAVIINQADRNDYTEFRSNGNLVRFYTFSERGVGLSRNNALMRTEADYALLADDDMVYYDGYPQLVEEQFQKYSDVDVLIFNLEEAVPTRYVIKEPFQVSKRNYMRFGAARVAFRPESVKKKNIFFHLYFGGGTPHSNGEDTIFLHDCLEKGLKIMAVPVTIAKLTEERESTWFQGYTEKYYRDRGALFKTLSPAFYWFLNVQFVLRKYRKDQNMPSRMDQLRYMQQGANEMKNK